MYIIYWQECKGRVATFASESSTRIVPRETIPYTRMTRLYFRYTRTDIGNLIDKAFFSSKNPSWQSISWCLVALWDLHRSLHSFSEQMPFFRLFSTVVLANAWVCCGRMLFLSGVYLNEFFRGDDGYCLKGFQRIRRYSKLHSFIPL